MVELDREMARALVESGYMPLDAYVEQFGPITSPAARNGSGSGEFARRPVRSDYSRGAGPGSGLPGVSSIAAARRRRQARA
jgi:hypothetical protein